MAEDEEQAVPPTSDKEEEEEGSKEPLDALCEEVLALRGRVAVLESMAHNNHELDEGAVKHIASRVIAHINTALRARFGNGKPM